MADNPNGPDAGDKSGTDKGDAPVTLEQIQEQMSKIGGAVEDFGKSQKGMRSLLDRRTSEWRQGLDKLSRGGGRSRPGSGWDDDPAPDPYADPAPRRSAVDEETQSTIKELREENEVLAERQAIQEFKSSGGKAAEYWPKVFEVLKDADQRDQFIVRDTRGRLDYGRSIKSVYLHLREQDLSTLEADAGKKKEEAEVARRRDIAAGVIMGDNVTTEEPTIDISKLEPDEIQAKVPGLFDPDNPPTPLNPPKEGK